MLIKLRGYATETNRLNRERRSSRDAWNAELEKTDRALDKAVDATLAGVPPQKLKDRMEALEARKTELICLVSDVPKDVPNLLPSASAIYSGKVTRLTEALNCPEERTEAAEVLRTLIEKIVYVPARNEARLTRSCTAN